MNAQPSTINIHLGRIYRPIQTKYITHFVADCSYTWIHTTDGKRYMISKPIGQIARLLPDFLRPHRSYLVNPAFMKNESKSLEESGQIRLSSGLILPVSRRKKISIVHQIKQQLVETSN